MTLTPALTTLEALWRKLEREAYRTFHTRDAIHRADHFFNFCVTAHSMRDFFLERQGKITDSDRQPFHALWSAQPLLVATAEIANLSKHYQLRQRRTRAVQAPKTQRVRRTRSDFVDVFANDRGDLRLVPVRAPDITVTLSDGTRYQLHAFTAGVLDYWRSYVRANGIRIRRQPLTALIGRNVSPRASRSS